MSNRYSIDDLLSGAQRGWLAGTMRFGLSCAERGYGLVIWLRNRCFDLGIRKIDSVSVPVISVGNLTAGGTGKTPMVRWVADSLKHDSIRPGIISRGYGSGRGIPNDEYLELEYYLPDVPHLQNPDRIAAARDMVHRHQSDLIILDDGFQHRRLARDVDIVLIDATRPFGYGHLIPRGLLRESVQSLRRADFVVITRVDQASETELRSLIDQIKEFVESQRIAKVSFRPSGWMDAKGQTHELSRTGDQSVIGFCGIGNPAAFRNSLENYCRDIIEFHSFADHYQYTEDDLNRLCRLANATDAQALLCTQKDMVKVRRLDQDFSTPIFALQFDMDFDQGQSSLLDQIRSVL